MNYLQLGFNQLIRLICIKLLFSAMIFKEVEKILVFIRCIQNLSLFCMCVFGFGLVLFCVYLVYFSKTRVLGTFVTPYNI